MPKGRTSARTPATSYPRWPGVRAAVISGCLLLTVVLLSVAGFLWVRNHLDRKVLAQGRPPQVRFTHRPTWMTDHLHGQLVASIRPKKAYSAFDHDLLVSTVRTLQQSPWVLRVNHVRRAFGQSAADTLEIDADFRAPVALVKWMGSYWLVDNEGVKLPEEYAYTEVPRIVLAADRRAQIRILEGVVEPPPEAGQVWNSPDLLAGLDMIKLLFAQPFAEDVVKIDVSNFQGRLDVREAQIVLVTRYGTQVRWGRPLDATDYFIEIPTARKLDILQQVYARYNRLDAGKKWLDIRFDNVTYPQHEPPEDARTSAAP